MYHTPYNKTIDAQMNKELFSPYLSFGFVIKYPSSVCVNRYDVCHCVQSSFVGSSIKDISILTVDPSPAMMGSVCTSSSLLLS